MSQFQKVILAFLSWAGFIAVAWVWCWIARAYPGWMNPFASAPSWWGTTAAVFTQLILLASSIFWTIKAATHGDLK